MTETQKVKQRYDRFARVYDVVDGIIERKLFQRLRKKTIPLLSGNVLEIGVGTGKNLQYYSNKAKVTAIDISTNMMERAQEKAEKLDVDVTFKQMDAQHLDFKDNSFDVVVTTFVLCSIPDPVQAAREIKRVLKPTGRAVLIEHVRSRHLLIKIWQHLHNPIMRRLTGANVNRNTRENLENAGLIVEKDEHLAFYDVFRRFTCRKR